MTKNHLFYSICILLCIIFSIRSNGQATALLSGRKKLTASDFKGSPDPKSDYLATTFTLLSYQYANPRRCAEKGQQKFTFETAIRMGEKSWMRFDKIKSKQLLEELLDHEQGHYDIADIFSVQLQKSLSGYCFNVTSYKLQIDSIYQSVNKYYSTLQSLYDTETNHGQNKEVQVKWKNRIDNMLKSMMGP